MRQKKLATGVDIEGAQIFKGESCDIITIQPTWIKLYYIELGKHQPTDYVLVYDLRWRIVCQTIALDLKFQKIAQKLNISVGTAHNIFKLFQATGKVDHK